MGIYAPLKGSVPNGENGEDFFSKKLRLSDLDENVSVDRVRPGVLNGAFGLTRKRVKLIIFPGPVFEKFQKYFFSKFDFSTKSEKVAKKRVDWVPRCRPRTKIIARTIRTQSDHVH